VIILPQPPDYLGRICTKKTPKHGRTQKILSTNMPRHKFSKNSFGLRPDQFAFAQLLFDTFHLRMVLVLRKVVVVHVFDHLQQTGQLDLQSVELGAKLISSSKRTPTYEWKKGKTFRRDTLRQVHSASAIVVLSLQISAWGGY